MPSPTDFSPRATTVQSDRRTIHATAFGLLKVVYESSRASAVPEITLYLEQDQHGARLVAHPINATFYSYRHYSHDGRWTPAEGNLLTRMLRAVRIAHDRAQVIRPSEPPSPDIAALRELLKQLSLAGASMQSPACGGPMGLRNAVSGF